MTKKLSVDTLDECPNGPMAEIIKEEIKFNQNILDVDRLDAMYALVTEGDMNFQEALLATAVRRNHRNISACVDIETLGTTVNSTIVSIAAAIFDKNDAPGNVMHTIEMVIDITDQKRFIDPNTVMWWMDEGMDQARADAFQGPKDERVQLPVALKRLNEFLTLEKVTELYACGPDFDCKMLEHAYRQYGLKMKIPFYKWGDIRTLEGHFYGKNTRKPGMPNWLGGTAHNALDDVLMEISVVQKTWQAAAAVGYLTK